MRITLLSLMIMVLLSSNLFAQLDYYAYEDGKMLAGTKTWICNDGAMLYSSPLESSEMEIRSLSACDQVTIIEASDMKVKYSTLVLPWYEVNVINNDTAFNGFVQGGDIAFAGMTVFLNGKKDLMLFSWAGMEYTGAYWATMSVYRNKKLVSDKDFMMMEYPTNEYQPAYSIGLSKDIMTGLDSVNMSVYLTYHSKSPTDPSGKVYFLWSGSEVFFIADAMNISEPGIATYNSHVIFPNEQGGKPGYVILKEELKEYDLEDETYVLAKEFITEYFWDGVKLELVEEDKPQIEIIEDDGDLDIEMEAVPE